jgi:ATP-binding cassette subfamily B protein
MIGVVRENAVGIRVVKALTKYDYEKRRFESANKEHVRAEQTAGMTMSSVNPIMNVILNIGTTLVVLVGAYRVYNGLMLPGTIISFIQYFSMISMSMLAVTRMFVMYSKASASANRVSEVIETPENILEESEESFPASEKKDLHIEFRDVVFSYNGRKNNIENISFDLKKGEKLGIIGATGSGKSTIILLLMRFYDIDSGAIYINGKDIRTYPKDELHTMFGVALQNDFVRNGTIRDNVAFDRELSDEELWRGATLAQAESFIKDKEGALDFVLNSKGTNLSGGQKQRILVSRALAGNPDILILDDSSSALDYKTDAALRNAVFAEMKESTVIIVAQRVSSVMQCDKILVIDEGKTIALGTHEELMDSCDIYREISESQMGGEVE